DPKSPLATEGAGLTDPSLPSYVGALPPEGVESWDWDRTWRMPVDAKVLTVSKDAKDGGQYRTIGEALAAAKPWATIRVLDDAVYAEALVLRDRVKGEGITLESQRGATLAFPAPARIGLTILGVPHVRVRGFRIRASRPNTICVVVSGRSEGTVLEGLRLS